MGSEGIKVSPFEVEKRKMEGHAKDDLNFCWAKPLKNWDRKIFGMNLAF